MKTMLQLAAVGLAGLVFVIPATASNLTAQQAFDQLKSLEGTWKGAYQGAGEEVEVGEEASGPAVHEIQVSAAGTVVMETMGPGTEHEMINMYHLDGDNLMVTHYCAGGNQPRMRLDLDHSSSDELVFAFVDGTNMDATTDHYIGSATIQIVDADHIESVWHAYSGADQTDTMAFHLARAD
jgi:hypothetical protein